MDKVKLKRLLLGEVSAGRLVRSVLFVVICLYAFMCFYGYFMSNRMMFPAPKPSYDDMPATRQISLDNGKLITIYHAEYTRSAFCIIYSHGNAVDLGMITPFLKRMAVKLKCSVVSYDYPGYGTSEGEPSEATVAKSIKAVYEYLKEKGVRDEQIVVWGRSVGSGPATLLAYKKPVSGLILESAFSSAFRVVTRIKILPFDRFPNIDRIAAVKCPVLFIHGRLDRVIPFHQGTAMYAKAKEPKSFLWLDKAGHNDVEVVGGDRYWLAVSGFLEKLKTK